jgi:hypothetical protein
MAPHTIAPSELRWNGDRLLRGKLARIILPDLIHAGMWRVQVDDRISDLLNVTRARDAARSVAAGILNADKTAPEAPHSAFSGVRVSQPSQKSPITARSAGSPSVMLLVRQWSCWLVTTNAPSVLSGAR